MITDWDYKEAHVHASDAFWDFPALDRTGGCGAGKAGDFLVPDSLYGLNVTFICQIHDWDYAHGSTEEDREKADRTFRNNLMRWVNHKTTFYPLKWLRLRRATTYYKAVSMFGGPSFWNTKHYRTQNEQTTKV